MSAECNMCTKVCKLCLVDLEIKQNEKTSIEQSICGNHGLNSNQLKKLDIFIWWTTQHDSIVSRIFQSFGNTGYYDVVTVLKNLHNFHKNCFDLGLAIVVLMTRLVSDFNSPLLALEQKYDIKTYFSGYSSFPKNGSVVYCDKNVCSFTPIKGKDFYKCNFCRVRYYDRKSLLPYSRGLKCVNCEILKHLVIELLCLHSYSERNCRKLRQFLEVRNLISKPKNNLCASSSSFVSPHNIYEGS
jgi:hypothetical protein